MGANSKRCSKCGAISNFPNKKCPYCGNEFQKVLKFIWILGKLLDNYSIRLLTGKILKGSSAKISQRVRMSGKKVIPGIVRVSEYEHQCGSTTFLFYIDKSERELVKTNKRFLLSIEKFNDLLEYAIIRLELPKTIKVLVTPLFSSKDTKIQHLGEFVIDYPSFPYNVIIHTKNLKREIRKFKGRNLLDSAIFKVFLHELAHFKTVDDNNAEELLSILIADWHERNNT